MVHSIMERQSIVNKLKYFDSQALHLLKEYVDFCTQLVEKLKPVS